ncbi:MAG TPA: AAA family ATPase [Methanospirillum sp.]|nr:AAA family ATPase [Methanospirillum sp.]
MRVTISGLPGSGTTSLTYHLAQAHGFEVISAGEVFRQMAKERGMTLAEFGEFCEGDPSIDRLIDEKQREIALERDQILIEGRLSGWMIPEADLRIWLKASLECRVRRILDRDRFADFEAAMKATEEREASEALRYRQYYQIDITSLGPYHLVLDTEMWTVDQLGQIVSTAVKAGKPF